MNLPALRKDFEHMLSQVTLPFGLASGVLPRILDEALFVAEHHAPFYDYLTRITESFVTDAVPVYRRSNGAPDLGGHNLRVLVPLMYASPTAARVADALGNPSVAEMLDNPYQYPSRFSRSYMERVNNPQRYAELAAAAALVLGPYTGEFVQDPAAVRPPQRRPSPTPVAPKVVPRSRTYEDPEDEPVIKVHRRRFQSTQVPQPVPTSRIRHEYEDEPALQVNSRRRVPVADDDDDEVTVSYKGRRGTRPSMLGRGGMAAGAVRSRRRSRRHRQSRPRCH